MTNWKTTLFGLLMAAAGAISTVSIPTSPTAQKVASWVLALASGGLGLTSKDYDVTGGTKQQ